MDGRGQASTAGFVLVFGVYTDDWACSCRRATAPLDFQDIEDATGEPKLRQAHEPKLHQAQPDLPAGSSY